VKVIGEISPVKPTNRVTSKVTGRTCQACERITDLLHSYCQVTKASKRQTVTYNYYR